MSNDLTNDKTILLANLIKELEHSYGKGAVMTLGANYDLEIEASSSGSTLIDQAIGIGGYPKGRIIEIFGPESSGKTTLSLHAISEIQRNGGVAAFIDAEHALDPGYAKKIGVVINDLIIAQPDSGEQALDILESLVKSNAVGIVVVDSVAALVPKVELEGEMSDQTIGAQARLMSKALRKLNGIINKTNCIVIFINQIREKIGVMFGSPETTSGGRALRFYASVRMEVRKIENITDSGNTIGSKIRVKIVKNKVAPPFKTTLVELKYNEGLDKYAEIIDLALAYGLIEKSGVWYSFNKQQLGQGKEKTKEFLKTNPEITESLQTAIRKQINEKSR